jgi:simple sugar transport system permease protein
VYRVDTTTIRANIGFIGIAVALLGRNTAVGVGLAALLFAALQTGDVAEPDPTISRRCGAAWR